MIINLIVYIILVYITIISVKQYKSVRDKYRLSLLKELDYIKKISSQKFEIRRLIQEKTILEENLVNSRYQSKIYDNQNLPPGTMDAVRYAVKCSHPDNGGNVDDFIKYNDCLKQLKKMGVN